MTCESKLCRSVKAFVDSLPDTEHLSKEVFEPQESTDIVVRIRPGDGQAYDITIPGTDLRNSGTISLDLQQRIKDEIGRIAK